MAEKVGRPTKYEKKYCEEIKAALAQGLSVTAASAKIGIASSTVKLWAKDAKYPEFSAAVKEGQELALLYWEEINLANAKSGKGSATSVIFGLKNRAPEEWRDKREVEISGSFSSELDEALKQLQEIDGQ